MRKFIVSLVLAGALSIPVGVAALDPSPPGSPQAAALATPNAVYLPAAGNACGIEFTPNTARTWWARYFIAPLDLAGVRPGLMPGSLVLTADEYAAAVTLNARGNTLPDAPRDFNPLALPVTPGLVGADGIAFCPTDSAAPPIPLGATVAAPAPARLGPTSAQLKAIRDRAVAVGKHPSAAQVLATWYRHN
jgi:hypothetical protein